MREKEIDRLKKTIQYLEERSEELRSKGMYQASIIYQDKAGSYKRRLKRWYSVKYV